MWEVFNMGCGFCVMVAPENADDAVSLLTERHPGTSRIGTLTGQAGTVSVPSLGIEGDADGLRSIR